MIVDEGQDFIAEWWLSIDDLLTDPGDGTMYVFYDPEQNIFHRDFGFLVGEARLTLDKNCRNTHQIASYVNRLSISKHEPADFAVEGTLPVERSVNSANSEAEEAEKIIHDLVHQKGLAPNRIVIVGRRRLKNSPFAECAQLAGIPLIDESAGAPDDAAIRYATIYRFKGLEADCVILSGFSRPKVGETQSELYCAASRAKLMLYALYRTDRKARDLGYGGFLSILSPVLSDSVPTCFAPFLVNLHRILHRFAHQGQRLTARSLEQSGSCGPSNCRSSGRNIFRLNGPNVPCRTKSLRFTLNASENSVFSVSSHQFLEC